MDYLLETEGLTKEYQGMEVVRDINMHIKKGEIYGFLGKNGAGKSTVMKMIMNLVQPTDGRIFIFGKEKTVGDYEYLKRIGSLIEEPVFYSGLTAKENLMLHCSYMGYPNKKEIDHVLEQMKLHNVGKKPIHSFSIGMKQRLAIARAILTKPELLILDEPINGLDPNGIKEMRTLFMELAKEHGTTILVSSHILSEIEHIADTIGVLANHHLVKEVSMESIHHLQGEYIELCIDDTKRAATCLDRKYLIRSYKIVDYNTIRIYDPSISKNEIISVLVNEGINIESISKRATSLEEYFLTMTEEAM